MRTSQCEIQALSSARKDAAVYESMLPVEQRKRLGQFFTGLPLSRLLTAVSIPHSFASVIDPMAGNGDLLDAVFERCCENKIGLRQVDAIEIDTETVDKCRRRLSVWRGTLPKVQQRIIAGSAFNPKVIGELIADAYDLVITNPPYVRYQTISRNGTDNGGMSVNLIRNALLEIIDARIHHQEQKIWQELIQGFSGLSDLSVPSWLLCAMLVKPGGILALVAPATWRTRDYADVLQYMLARFFSLHVVIADKQPGWFSEALVRTNLVIAKRLSSTEAYIPLKERHDNEKTCLWIEVAATAKEGDSLVGAAFPTNDPESSFASWVQKPKKYPLGLSLNLRKQSDEIACVLSRCQKAKWFRKVELLSIDVPLFGFKNRLHNHLIPHALMDIVQKTPDNIVLLEQLGVKISQGLRTGCNDFFYVDQIERHNDQYEKVRSSRLLGNRCFKAPSATLSPVLRRQSEVKAFTSGEGLKGRVLDLRGYVLPEDYSEVEQTKSIYSRLGLSMPLIMPEELADHVRLAANARHGRESHGIFIPDLSAVRTNIRPVRSGSRLQIPRFWYMLPNFSRRHLPEAFVPRINQRTPFVFPNYKTPIIIDANFSTIWSENKQWTVIRIVGILNSCWTRACMEAIGTPMGGGALKLEATHLRKIPLPVLDEDKLKAIDLLNAKNSQDEIDRLIVCSLFNDKEKETVIIKIIRNLRQFIFDAKKSRERR